MPNGFATLMRGTLPLEEKEARIEPVFNELATFTAQTLAKEYL